MRNYNQTEAPASGQVKIRSGRSSRRAYASQKALRDVGGYASNIGASLAPSGAPLCVVVDPITGMRDGKPFRF